ncbi:MAG TPA: type IV pili methyl-accepting chemotaxis transducer N-terminal domain-containing protein [Pricia sp.]|nr:type IV pili methyl-accepting chemotaxis transducer N-terminal domain-containing protein [Pricia sp.]
MSDKKSQKSLDAQTFLKIRKWYLLALAGIAFTIIVAQVLIQRHLDSQLSDSRVINLAGRQRAYSQKLVKEVLLLQDATFEEAQEKIVPEIRKTLLVWKESHEGLQEGSPALGLPVEDDVAILAHFREIEPHYSAMATAAENILRTFSTADSIPTTTSTANPMPTTVSPTDSIPKTVSTLNPIPSERLQNDISILLKNEPHFLRLMDTIVNEYDRNSKEKLQDLKRKELLLLAFSLLILLLEILFIFRPLSLQVRKTIADLLDNQKKSEVRAREIQELYTEKEKSLQELQELNFVIDNAALFASARKDGSVVFISKKFKNLLGIADRELNKPLSEILTTDAGQREYLREILKSNRKNVIRNEEIKIMTVAGDQVWLDMSIVPMHPSSRKQSVLILCSDITERKKNLLKVEQLTQQNFEERMQQKKAQASQIVEGQEEERKRIAKDIHDGIGQMLTALKFNIESIDPSQTQKTTEKIAYLKDLTADLIRGVRTATFNLTPPELGDHGIFPALRKMTEELSKLTGKTILFENKAEGHMRFDSLAETNIYRVTQEAVNNSIKYAQANYILVSINFKDSILSVVVDDDGKGFDDTILGEVPKNTSEGGMGLFFMKERIDYINGRLFINSVPGKGTRVTINYRTEDKT